MASNAKRYPDEPVDPVDEELAALLADPEVAAGLAADLAEEERGELELHSHNEARRIVGLPPLPEYE